MKLSLRLKTIADIIPECSRVLDVGCDHGLLDIYLSLEKKCHCLALDINEHALASAKINIKKYHAINVDTILTDGLSHVDIHPDDYIVIAGMGTSTIIHILTTNKLSNHLILASNNQLYELRSYVTKLGYKIKNEYFVLDHQKKYVIIEFIKGQVRYSKSDLQYGPILKNDMSYLIFLLDKLFKIKENVQYSSFKERYYNQKEINRIKRLIKKNDTQK